MKLRYAGNVLPFEDGMKKVAAITWSSSGKKLAIGAADRVHLYLSSRSISSMKMGNGRINSLPSLQIKVKRAISSEDWNSLLTLKKLLLHKVITLSLSTKLVLIGDKRRQFATNSQWVLQWLLWLGQKTILMSWFLDWLMEKFEWEFSNQTNQTFSMLHRVTVCHWHHQETELQ